MKCWKTLGFSVSGPWQVLWGIKERGWLQSFQGLSSQGLSHTIPWGSGRPGLTSAHRLIYLVAKSSRVCASSWQERLRHHGTPRTFVPLPLWASISRDGKLSSSLGSTAVPPSNREAAALHNNLLKLPSQGRKCTMWKMKPGDRRQQLLWHQPQAPSHSEGDGASDGAEWAGKEHTFQQRGPRQTLRDSSTLQAV